MVFQMLEIFYDKKKCFKFLGRMALNLVESPIPVFPGKESQPNSLESPKRVGPRRAGFIFYYYFDPQFLFHSAALTSLSSLSHLTLVNFTQPLTMRLSRIFNAWRMSLSCSVRSLINDNKKLEKDILNGIPLSAYPLDCIRKGTVTILVNPEDLENTKRKLERNVKTLRKSALLLDKGNLFGFVSVVSVLSSSVELVGNVVATMLMTFGNGVKNTTS